MRNVPAYLYLAGRYYTDLVDGSSFGGERFPCRCELAVCSVGAMTNMMGGTGVMWLWMGIGAIVTLALTAAVVFVLIAGGRWLWRDGDPSVAPPRSG